MATKKKETIREQKVSASMREFKKGNLYSSSGHKVTNRNQAIAIALSQGRRYASGGPKVKRTWGGVRGMRPALKKKWATVSKAGKGFVARRRSVHSRSTGSVRAARARAKKKA